MHKGKTSGFVQKVIDLRIDDDQDALWMSVDIGNGASCHVGYNHVFIDQYLWERLKILKRLN